MFTLVRNADCFTPAARGVCDVLVAADRLAWIGEHLPPIPDELEVVEIDVGGRRLIPGLIDAHVHPTGGGGESGGARYRVPPVPLSRFTSAGTTTIVGVLGTDDVTRAIAELVAAVRGLNEEGLTAFCHTGGYHVPPVTLTGGVREDIVAVDVIIGVGEIAISDHRSSQPTLDEILRLASEAHVAGLMTGKAGIIHLHVGDGERGLGLVREALETAEVPARVYNPTHVNRRSRLFEEAMELAGRGCTIDVTAFPVEGADDAIAAEQAVVRYLDSGLAPERITVSSDGGGCLPEFDSQGNPAGMVVAPPAALGDCLRRLLELGQPMERVLPAFTANVADLLRLEDRGRIVAGACADLVVLDERGAACDVMCRGRWHVRDGEPVRRGRFEEVS